MEFETIINISGTFRNFRNYLGNSQNTTGQPEVQGTQTQHNQQYQEDLDNLGTHRRLITDIITGQDRCEMVVHKNHRPYPELFCTDLDIHTRHNHSN